MMLYKNMKVKVRSPDGDTDFFDIIVGVLQEDPLNSVRYGTCYVLWSSIDLTKENGFTREKGKK